ncbi:MAG: iron ABC transporter permease [Bacteriovoracaceae bacterium]|nr:iron ABC transporter permease [Bacteriovoracaceae bacterium]
MKKIITSPLFILGFAILLVVILCLYPYSVLVGKILFPPPGDFTLKYFLGIVSKKSTFIAVKNTLWISTLTSIFSVVIAMPLAWLLSRSNLVGQRKWRTLFLLPYAIPPYIGAIAWVALANPTNGFLNSLFGQGFFNIYSYFGLVWVMSSFFYTYILLSMLTALDRSDPSLEEAARLSGVSPLRVFFQITLPIVKPSLMSGVLLVFLASAASFGIPALIGGPARIYMVTTKIYTFQQTGSFTGLYLAGALSVLLLILGLVGLIINQRLSAQALKSVSGKSSRVSQVNLGSMTIPALILVSFLFLILFLLPVGSITLSALSPYQGKIVWSELGLQHFRRVFFETQETPRAILNSFKLAISAATITTVLGMLLAYFRVKTKIKFRSVIEIIAAVPYATPGTVLAFALILTFSQSFLGLPISLYNTLAMIALAYSAHYLNFALRTTADGLAQVDDVLAEAARVSGASWFVTMRTIWFPLLKPALVASWFLVFMPAMTELTMTILLTGPGLETLGTLIFQMQDYSDASGGGTAVLSLCTIIGVIILNSIVKLLSKGKYGL